MEKMIFCRIGWMTYYQGFWKEKSIRGGGSWVDKHGYGHEIYNYYPDKQNIMYGFVQVKGKIDINRHGANWRDDNISNITVIWCSRSIHNGQLYMIGWYKNATVFRKLQEWPKNLTNERPLPNPDDNWMYRCICNKKDSVLLQEDERNFIIPIATTEQNGFGRANIWHADSKTDIPFKNKVIEFIANYERSSPVITKKVSKSINLYQADIEKRQAIELSAMNTVSSWYKDKGWNVEDVSNKNLGWDIEAKLENQILLIEVKGLSGNNINFELTPQEYEKMKNPPFNCIHKICVVSNALSSDKMLYHLKYNNSSNSLINENNKKELHLQERTAARVTE
ncbi:MAG: protein NO VEIN domain-containing protein [Eubacteriaceae bacterium]